VVKVLTNKIVNDLEELLSKLKTIITDMKDLPEQIGDYSVSEPLVTPPSSNPHAPETVIETSVAEVPVEIPKVAVPTTVGTEVHVPGNPGPSGESGDSHPDGIGVKTGNAYYMEKGQSFAEMQEEYKDKEKIVKYTEENKAKFMKGGK
jgi:hypothetical protein